MSIPFDSASCAPPAAATGTPPPAAATGTLARQGDTLAVPTGAL